MQSQVGEVLMFLEALIQSPEDWRDSSVAEPECSSGKNIGGCGVRSWIISPIGSNIIFKRVRANNFWNIISHGYDLRIKKGGVVSHKEAEDNFFNSHERKSHI